MKSAEFLRPGTTRADVEKDFELDGGGQMSPESVYVWRKCPLIHMKVYFEEAAGSKGFSSEDIVKKHSKLYLEYPHKD